MPDDTLEKLYVAFCWDCQRGVSYPKSSMVEHWGNNHARESLVGQNRVGGRSHAIGLYELVVERLLPTEIVKGTPI